jgi:hypothetical protein
MTALFPEAIRRFDAENARDPNTEIVDGKPLPRELAYAQRLTDWVQRLCPDASEALRLAARCQHLCRWESPREGYPMTRAGYLKWRADLKQFHARKSGEILRAVGYPDDLIARVQQLNLKQAFPHDPETRVLEDALCLVFLEHQFAPLVAKSDPDKMINAAQKTWQKMTPAAQKEALKLTYPAKAEALLRQALAPTAAS